MNIIERAKNIIVTPKAEWEKISSEETTLGNIVSAYAVPLSIIPAVASFIGYGFIGYSVPFFGRVTGITWGINYAIISFVGAILGVIITAFVVDMLAPSFGSQKNLGKAAQLVAYSYTPAWIAGVFHILPSLGIVAGLLGLYGIYLMYLGLPKMMKTPEDKTVVYLIVTIVVLIVVYFIIAAVLGALMASVLGLTMFR